MRFLLLRVFMLAIFAFVPAGWVFAACSNPSDANIISVRWHADGTGEVFPISTTSVSATASGAIVYDNTASTLKVCDGTDWVPINSNVGASCDASATSGGDCNVYAAIDGATQGGTCVGGSGNCSAECSDGSWINQTDTCVSSCPTQVKSWGSCSDTASAGDHDVQRSLSYSSYGSCTECGTYYTGSATATCNDGTWDLSGTSCTSNSCSCNVICFIAGTQVRMADGSTKAIEEIEVGDMVAGRNGEANEVLELFQPVKKPGHLLFAFNNDHHFVTEDHPFMTMEGWKSMNPALTAVSSPQLEVGQLQVGDVLVTENGKVEVKTISQKAITEATPAYNFRLSGDGMYYADGYLVSDYQGRKSVKGGE